MIGPRLTERHKQLAIKWTVRFVFVLVGWILAVQPALVKIKLNKNNTKDVGERSRLILEIHMLQEKNKQFDASLPKTEDSHALLGKISKLAGDNHFDVQSLVPTSTSSGAYTKVRLNLKAQASFASLFKFLKGFEELKLAGAVVRMSVMNELNRSGLDTPPQIDMVLETYLKKA